MISLNGQNKQTSDPLLKMFGKGGADCCRGPFAKNPHFFLDKKVRAPFCGAPIVSALLSCDLKYFYALRMTIMFLTYFSITII